MKKPTLKINHKVEFIFGKENLGRSLIQDVKEECFFTTIPMKGFKSAILHKGEELQGIYYEEGNNVYMFQCRVLGRMVENIPLYILSKPGAFEKVQRRNFVRIPTTIPLLYLENSSDLDQKIKKQELKEIEKTFVKKWEKGNTIDLSGGGMKISTQKPFKVNQQIFCILQYEEMYMGIKGEVVRCNPVINPQQTSYHTCMKFIDIPESKREKIISFIFRTLRDLRKKEC